MIVLISILSISSVNASENVTDNIDNVVATEEVVNIDDSANDVVSVENQDNDLLNANPKTFRQLNTAINGNDDIDVYLDGNYTFTPGTDDEFKEGIVINRQMTIYGNGFTLDGAHSARIFSVSEKDIYNEEISVFFHDIVFINANNSAIKNGNVINCTFINNTASQNPGGAIFRGYAVNCTFINNIASQGPGGAIYESDALNCTFINNKANNYGGAMYRGDAVNCTFINNSANEEGGAICGGNAENCTFINNTAQIGGAICARQDALAINCTFINNSATENGGAIYGVINGLVGNCTFINNAAKNGGAIYRCDVYDCIFIDNDATEKGGAIYGDEIHYLNTASDCIFEGNSAKNGGAVYMTVAYYSDFISNTAAEKGGALYNGSSYYCYFEGNKANIGDNDAYASTLVKFSTKLTSPAKVNTVYNDQDYLVITLRDQFNNPFIGYIIFVNIDGKTTKYYTYEKGQAEIPTEGLAPGTHNVKITFNGDSNFGKSTATSKIVVKKATPYLIAKKATFKAKKKTKKYSIVLIDDYGDAIKNVKVTLKVKGKTFKATTNSKGKATFKIKKLTKKGKHKATVIFAGNKYYNTKSVKTKIKIK